MPDIRMVPQRYEEHVEFGRLTRHPANPNDGDVGLLAALLEANGFAGAVMAQESTGILIDGGTRLDTAEAEGMTGVPVLWVDCTDDERDRFLASWNESGRRGLNNPAKLIALLKGLAPTPRGLEGCAFDGADLDRMIYDMTGPRPLGTSPDDAPPLPAAPVTRPGDLWHLGDHRLLCGDATSAGDVARLLGGEVCDAMWADPPHGAAITGGARAGGGAIARHADPANLTIAGDTRDPDALTRLLDAAWHHAGAALRPGAPVYACYSAGPPWHVPAQCFEAAGWLLRETLIWVKDTAVVSNLDYHGRHEPILYGFTPGAKGKLGRGGKRWHGPNTGTTVFEHPRPARSDAHPTIKPVALILAHLENSTAPGQLVYDPFAGSGSVLIAAHTARRAARCMEIFPGYCDVICARWAAAAGEDPRRADGTPWSALAPAPAHERTP